MTKAEEIAAEATVKIHDTAVKEGEEYAKTHGRSIFEEVCYGRGFKAGYIRGYKEAYEQAEKDIIDKACRWLKKNWVKYPNPDVRTEQLVADFRRAMEE